VFVPEFVGTSLNHLTG